MNKQLILSLVTYRTVEQFLAKTEFKMTYLVEVTQKHLNYIIFYINHQIISAVEVHSMCRQCYDHVYAVHLSHGINQIRCDCCHEIFRTAHFAVEHYIRVHFIRQFYCTICPHTTLSFSQARDHALSHAMRDDYGSFLRRLQGNWFSVPVTIQHWHGCTNTYISSGMCLFQYFNSVKSFHYIPSSCQHVFCATKLYSLLQAKNSRPTMNRAYIYRGELQNNFFNSFHTKQSNYRRGTVSQVDKVVLAAANDKTMLQPIMWKQIHPGHNVKHVYCLIQFTYASVAAAHFLIRHFIREYQCTACTFSATTEASATAHAIRHHHNAGNL